MFLAFIKDVIHTKFEMLLGSEGLLYYMASTVLGEIRCPSQFQKNFKTPTAPFECLHTLP